MTEQQIQSKRIKQLEEEGYYVLKLIKTNKNGIPDILAIPKNVKVLFSEVKTPKGVVKVSTTFRPLLPFTSEIPESRTFVKRIFLDGNKCL